MLLQGLVVGVFQLLDERLKRLQDGVELFKIEGGWVDGEVDGWWHEWVLVQADRRWGVLLKQSK